MKTNVLLITKYKRTLRCTHQPGFHACAPGANLCGLPFSVVIIDPAAYAGEERFWSWYEATVKARLIPGAVEMFL